MIRNREIYKKIGNKIRVLLSDRGQTYADLGEILGMSRQNVQLIVDGKIAMSLDRCLEIAQLYGLTLNDLTGVEESPERFYAKEMARMVLTEMGKMMQDASNGTPRKIKEIA